MPISPDVTVAIVFILIFIDFYVNPNQFAPYYFYLGDLISASSL